MSSLVFLLLALAAVDGDPPILERPFTADQIREAWVPGLVLEVERKSPEGEVDERWTVMASDADGAYIEYATLDDDGAVTGEPRLERSTWIELRNHATFDAAVSRREEVTRETALGVLDGWLYTVTGPDGSVSQFFFARSYPGAPVELLVTKGEDVLIEFRQTGRRLPD